MIEVKLSFTCYEDALEAMIKLAGEGKAVIQAVTPTHQHVKAETVKKEKTIKPEPVNAEVPAPVVEAPVAPVVEPPTPPAFIPPVTEPVAAPVASTAPDSVEVPFNDQKGMIGYVMGAYKTLGPQKGAGIQAVLQGLGYGNINDVDPKDYIKLYQGIEQLKG